MGEGDVVKGNRLKKWKDRLKKLLQFCLNPHLLLCFGIAWTITNGWCYLFMALGGKLHITWMFIAGSSWAFVLWLPFTPEKIVTLLITIFLLRVLFPKDEKTLAVMQKELHTVRRSWNDWRAKRRRKRRVKKIAKLLSNGK